MKSEKTVKKPLAVSTLEDFTNVYHKYHKAVYLNVLRITGDEHAAMDILQEVFIKLWEKRKYLQARDSVDGWLFTVSYNQSVSYLRKKLRTGSENIEGRNMAVPEAESEEEEQNKLRAIQEAVNCLSPKKKEIFILSLFEGRSREEIVEITGLSHEVIRDYLNQSQKQIRRYIGIRYPHLINSSLFFWQYLINSQFILF